MAKNKKVIRYKKPLNINVGMIIFAMIFVYLSFSVYTYIRRDKIQFYEVVEGSRGDRQTGRQDRLCQLLHKGRQTRRCGRPCLFIG